MQAHCGTSASRGLKPIVPPPVSERDGMCELRTGPPARRYRTLFWIGTCSFAIEYQIRRAESTSRWRDVGAAALLIPRPPWCYSAERHDSILLRSRPDRQGRESRRQRSVPLRARIVGYSVPPPKYLRFIFGFNNVSKIAPVRPPSDVGAGSVLFSAWLPPLSAFAWLGWGVCVTTSTSRSWLLAASSNAELGLQRDADAGAPGRQFRGDQSRTGGRIQCADRCHCKCPRDPRTLPAVVRADPRRRRQPINRSAAVAVAIALHLPVTAAAPRPARDDS